MSQQTDAKQTEGRSDTLSVPESFVLEEMERRIDRVQGQVEEAKQEAQNARQHAQQAQTSARQAQQRAQQHDHSCDRGIYQPRPMHHCAIGRSDTVLMQVEPIFPGQ